MQYYWVLMVLNWARGKASLCLNFMRRRRKMKEDGIGVGVGSILFGAFLKVKAPQTYKLRLRVINDE